MASRNALLAEAVKDALNVSSTASEFVTTFTAKRLAAPVADVQALRTLTVTVISGGDDNERTGRDVNEHDLTVFVGVEKQISVDPSTVTANAEIDTLMELVEQINDWFSDDTVSPSLGLFVNSTIRTLSDPPSMLTQHVFRGVIAATFDKPI